MAVLYHFAFDFYPQFVLLRASNRTECLGADDREPGGGLILILIYGANLQRSPVKRAAVADLG